MGFYQARPVVKEAMQLTSDNVNEVVTWIGSGARYGEDHSLFVIQTIEGDMRASVGDWIIKGLRGEFYPCRSDIFEQTYEAVSPFSEIGGFK